MRNERQIFQVTNMLHSFVSLQVTYFVFRNPSLPLNVFSFSANSSGDSAEAMQPECASITSLNCRTPFA